MTLQPVQSLSELIWMNVGLGVTGYALTSGLYAIASKTTNILDGLQKAGRNASHALVAAGAFDMMQLGIFAYEKLAR